MVNKKKVKEPVLLPLNPDHVRIKLRELDRKVEKLELREVQLIILLKRILEGYIKKSKKPLSYQDIVKYMDSIVRERLSNNITRSNDDIDLVEELVSKQL